MSAIQFEGVINFRDYGGHPVEGGGNVRRGVLYRSAHYGNTTASDLDLIRRLGIATVIDFRGDAEKDEEGWNNLPDGVIEVMLPMHSPADSGDPRPVLARMDPTEIASVFPPGRAFEYMLRGAEGIVASQDRRAQYRVMLDTIIDAEGAPVVIHCSAGKDRTGWGAALTLAVLGVPYDRIEADYLESNRHPRRERLEAIEKSGVDPELLAPFFGVRAEYVTRMFDIVNEQFGGIERYVRDGLGITDDRVRLFRQVMIER